MAKLHSHILDERATSVATTAGYHKPRPLNCPKSDVFDFAEKVAKRFSLIPGAAIEPVVKALGGKIRPKTFTTLEDVNTGSIRVEAKGNFTINLPADVGPLRNRFTMAHELGHYLLHAPEANFRLEATRYGSDRAEWEANWFAAALLMPSKAFKKSFGKHGGDLLAVAEEFQVSQQAASIRAKALNLK